MRAAEAARKEEAMEAPMPRPPPVMSTVLFAAEGVGVRAG